MPPKEKDPPPPPPKKKKKKKKREREKNPQGCYKTNHASGGCTTTGIHLYP